MLLGGSMNWKGMSVEGCSACEDARRRAALVKIDALTALFVGLSAAGVAVFVFTAPQLWQMQIVALVLACVSFFMAWSTLFARASSYMHCITNEGSSVHTHLATSKSKVAASIVINHKNDCVIVPPSVPKGVLFRVEERLVNGKVHVVTENGDEFLDVPVLLWRISHFTA